MANILISGSSCSNSISIWFKKWSALKSLRSSNSKGPVRQLNFTMKSMTILRETNKWFFLMPIGFFSSIYSQKTCQKMLTLVLFSRQYNPSNRSPLALSYLFSYSLMMDINDYRSQLCLSLLIQINIFLVFSSSYSNFFVISWCRFFMFYSIFWSVEFFNFYKFISTNSFYLRKTLSSGLFHSAITSFISFS